MAGLRWTVAAVLRGRRSAAVIGLAACIHTLDNFLGAQILTKMHNGLFGLDQKCTGGRQHSRILVSTYAVLLTLPDVYADSHARYPLCELVGYSRSTASMTCITL